MSPHASRLRLEAELLRRLLLVASLFVLAGLGAWRAQQSVSPPPALSSETASFEENRLTQLLSTVAGPGQSEVRLSLRADDTWSVLVLVNSESPATELSADTIETLIGSAFPLDPISGDEITIQRVPFAQPAPGQFSRKATIELAVICLCAGLVALALMMPTRRPTPAHSAPVSPPSPTTHAAMSADAPRNFAARSVEDDPARAAHIVRQWLRQGPADA